MNTQQLVDFLVWVDNNTYILRDLLRTERYWNDSDKIATNEDIAAQYAHMKEFIANATAQ